MMTEQECAAALASQSAQIAELQAALEEAKENTAYRADYWKRMHDEVRAELITFSASAEAQIADLKRALDTARHDAMEEADELDAATAALVALAEAGIPTDIQELLVRGDPLRSIAPGALSKCFRAAIRSLSASPLSQGGQT